MRHISLRWLLKYVLLIFYLVSEYSDIKLLNKHFFHFTILGTVSTKTNVLMNMLKMIVKTENASTNFATKGTESLIRMD